MKKMFFLAIAAMGLMMVSCSKEAKSTENGEITADTVEVTTPKTEVETANVGGSAVARKMAGYTEQMLSLALSQDQEALEQLEHEVDEWSKTLSLDEAKEALEAAVATVSANYDNLLEGAVEQAMEQDPSSAAMGKEALLDLMKTVMPKDAFIQMMRATLQASIDAQQ